MILEEAIARTNPPGDRKEVLRQFNEANAGKPDGYVEAMTDMICSGEVVVYLDQERILIIKAPHLTN
jgi:hypothetical protein